MAALAMKLQLDSNLLKLHSGAGGGLPRCRLESSVAGRCEWWFGRQVPATRMISRHG